MLWPLNVSLRLFTNGSIYYSINRRFCFIKVPVGNIPRGLTIFTHGENTRNVQPGDHVLVTGVFLPAVRGTLAGRMAAANSGGASALISDTYLEAHTITPLSKTDSNLMLEPTEEEVERLAGRTIILKLVNFMMTTAKF